MSKQRVLGLFGNPNDINCWSNIPYFFLQAGKAANFFQLGLGVNLQNLKYPRLCWNLKAPLRGEALGGFQYTKQANELLFQTANIDNIGEIISHFQLFPPYELCQAQGISFSHYIDFPLVCLFEDYGIAKTIGDRTAQQALQREKEQYQAASYIVCMSPWAAQQVVERYDIDKSKVKVIVPGANLPESAFSNKNSNILSLSEPPDGKKYPLKIAFVGKDYKRKGLDRLVAAVRILTKHNYNVRLRVIGPSKKFFPNDLEIEHLGFINKLYEPLRLITELQSCHIGALLSYQEALGIAALEYLRCGLPSLLTNTGGLGTTIPVDCCEVLPVDCTEVDVAECLIALLTNPERFQKLRIHANRFSGYASWQRTIQDFQRLWFQESTNF